MIIYDFTKFNINFQFKTQKIMIITLVLAFEKNMCNVFLANRHIVFTYK